MQFGAALDEHQTQSCARTPADVRATMERREELLLFCFQNAGALILQDMPGQSFVGPGFLRN